MNKNNSLLIQIWNKNSVKTGVFLFGIFLLPVFFASDSTLSLLTKCFIFMLYAVSLNLQLGYADMPALGQGMYFGLGAYGYTLLRLRAGISLFPSFLILIVVTIIIAMVIGYICLRSGTLFGFIFLNMGFGLLLYRMISKWMWIGADGGLIGAPRPSFAEGNISFYLFTYTIVGICLILLYFIRRAPLTNMLLASRENGERLRFLGVRVTTVKWYCHIISAVFTVIAGILIAMRSRAAYPTFLDTLLTSEMTIAIVVGGKNVFMGPVLGAFILTLVNTGVSNYTRYYQLVLGIIILIAVYFLSGGIIPGIMKKKQKLKKFTKLVKTNILNLLF